MTSPAYIPLRVSPHSPSCHVHATEVSSSVVEIHSEDKLTVPLITYSWYKDTRTLSTAYVPGIKYNIVNKTGTNLSNSQHAYPYMLVMSCALLCMCFS